MKTKTLLFSAGFILLISTCLFSQAGSPNVNFIATPYNVCPGETVQFTDMTTNNPTTWLWSFKDGSPATSTLQSPVVVYNSAGNYDVILTASNDKGIHTLGRLSSVKVMACTNIDEFENNFRLQIFPNPAVSCVNISANMDAKFTLINVLGSETLKGDLKKDELNKVNLDNLPSGIYFIRIESSLRSKSYKVVKQ